MDAWCENLIEIVRSVPTPPLTRASWLLCCPAGIHFPWNIQGPIPFMNIDLPVISFADIAAAGSPADMWDAVPTAGKLQILLVIGFLEARAPLRLPLHEWLRVLLRVPLRVPLHSSILVSAPSSPHCTNVPSALISARDTIPSLPSDALYAPTNQMHGETSMALNLTLTLTRTLTLQSDARRELDGT